MEIVYLEDDDDETPQPQRPRLPQASTKAQSYRPPVSRGSQDTAWFICTNDTCEKAGHVATGKHTPTHQVKRGRCGRCNGLGIVVAEDGDQCETCGGSGRKIIREWDETLPVYCPSCHRPMEFLQEGAFPVGYQRMSTPHSEREEDLRGQVGFGRTRKVE